MFNKITLITFLSTAALAMAGCSVTSNMHDPSRAEFVVYTGPNCTGKSKAYPFGIAKNDCIPKAHTIDKPWSGKIGSFVLNGYGVTLSLDSDTRGAYMIGQELQVGAVANPKAQRYDYSVAKSFVICRGSY
ncbi:hypothetical protein BJ138DRAFT_1101331 [Hygrophoropsis aurantiaca]|uniref:Uncharacterized protein n=1 Tax=Hygrophoropsis aurantiaca TaxID=72124 RepID=A0ACB8AEF5_9AGAM|nr:hypothetical protein BJ138DRAFT_1101331 [Hygrophoropsis aurantiaca]